jgi:hydroxypyruvate reductase
MTNLFQLPDPARKPRWWAPLEVLSAALEASDPATAVHRRLSVSDDTLTVGDTVVDLRDVDRVFLVGAGKAAPGMVRAVEEELGEHLSRGVAVAPRGSHADTAGLQTTMYEGGHPVPDPAGLMASRHIARVLDGTTARDLVVAVISGGASALLEIPAARIPLADLQAATRVLLASGAPIEEVNTVRKHISAVKGGGLARLAAPARLITLLLSDVVGSPLDVIASGPTVPDETTFEDTVEILDRHDLWDSLPPSITDHIRAGAAGRVPETARADDAVFQRCTTIVVGDGAAAAEAAQLRAQQLGYATMLLTTFMVGEARQCGCMLAAVGKEVSAHGRPLAGPACVIASGETTVTLRDRHGLGGRNQELALAAALSLEGWDDVVLAAMDTDGIDGDTAAAGAIVDGTTTERGRIAGKAPAAALDGHDSGTFFAVLGDALVTGPTGTNVNDIVVMMVGSATTVRDSD